MKANINYQAAYDYLLEHNLAFCFQPDGSMITLQKCVEVLSDKSDLTLDQVLEEMEALNL